MQLSILIPLYNEKDFILETLQKILEVPMPDYVQSREVVIINDCSQDGSLEIVSEFAANHNDVTVVSHEKNRGKGAAIRTGMAAASGDVYFIQDADLELDPNDLPVLLDAMDKLGVQFVNGSRYLPGPLRPVSSYWRYWGNRLFTSWTSLLINVKLTDMASGSKLFHKELVEQINLTEDRFGFEAELILKSLRVRKNNVVEVPVHYFPRNQGEGKKLKWYDGFKILWTIIKFGLFRIK